ncbi:outer membrane protein [Deinococcus sp. SM5_A1]|uniref:outer membrane protein n=1 Tax=Deinococcus sp. SM5_A1 TaxID=3379094 RepID=UPI00385CD2ED
MKKLISLTILAAVATAGAQSFNNLELGLTGGYAGGLSGEVFVHAPNVIGPVGVKVGVAYTRPRDSINDASPEIPGLSGPGQTFGVAKQAGRVTESGNQTVVSVDGTYGLGEVAPGIDTMVYGGARYGMFKSTEDYGTSGNTTYSSNAFGLGAGAMASYALTGNLSLVADLGADYFFKSTINSNTTRADGSTASDSVSTADGSYSAFDSRVVRPGTNFKARLGVKYMF